MDNQQLPSTGNVLQPIAASPAGSNAGSGGTGEAPTPPPCLWLDSGASFHTVGDATILTGLRLPPAGMSVTFASGAVLQVAAVGEIRRPWFSIPDVYLVPGLMLNLISVRQLDRGSGIYAVFCNGCCGLWAGRPGQGRDLVGGGAVDVDQDMYRLSFLEVPPRLA